MPIETRPYDSAHYLDTFEALAAYVDEVFKTGDPDFIAHALKIAARSPRMVELMADRRAYLIEDLPDDLAAALEAGLDELWNPDIKVEDGDTLIG